METKGERTRRMIVQRSAMLFNRYGYSGTSMSAIIAATGIKKGGIYRYFEGKEHIAAEAFAYAIDLRIQNIRQIVEAEGDAVQRLLSLIRSLLDLDGESAIPGGCPILNAAVESDDGLPELMQVRDEAVRGLNELLRGVRTLIQVAVAQGELPQSVQPDEVASMLVSLCEGAIMLSRLQRDTIHKQHAFDHLERYISGLRLA